ncbi:protein transport protein [Pseudozyma hubeiensis SY62]|uniref:Protein transport protein n=1 Tax=Pseudozyma hubeiensis (strain SY62) TaxID=1305764 RepID=R9P3F7_PSEHS|nr:protein transport protein [Pseudozyma hubeiensis SY62]GAC95871.1 protein transport protein [Pseudozyma hubeiensis SY62]
MDSKAGRDDDVAGRASSTRQLGPGGDNNTLQLPPSHSSLSVRSDYDDASSAGYMTASSSRVSQLDSEPLTALPRINFESMQSSTPRKGSSPASSPSVDSIKGGDSSSGNTSQANMTSLSSVTTFVPSTLSDHESSSEDDDDNLLSETDKDTARVSTDSDFVPSYDFDLRDAHERTMYAHHGEDDDQDHATDGTNDDQTLTLREGDVITVSHSHSTSINAYFDSTPHSRSTSQHGSSSPREAHSHHNSSFSVSLSSSWPSLALPPSAVKLHRKRRSILVRLLKTWEGREQVLHLTHSLVLLFYSSLDHPVPQTYRGALLRPAGTVLAMSFPKPVRVALMQRIYTTAEGIDNFRRVILIARWVTSATESVMEHWQHRQDHKRQLKRAAELAEREQLEIKLTGDEPIDTESDHVEAGLSWLQPPSISPLDANRDGGKEGGEQSFARAPAAKLGKMTGRGDATGAVGADVAENADEEKHDSGAVGKATQAPASRASSALARVWASLWRLSHLEAAAESLATIGEACETAAVLAGGGMFWRAVGIQRLGLPFLSRRRRQGIERLGIVLSLCSVLLSLLVLRMERKALRSELRSAHRRIIRANDKLGWSTDVAGITIDRDQAMSHRKRDPSVGSRSRTRSGDQPLELLGADMQAVARDLDDQEEVSSSSSLSRSDSNLSDDWTVVPDVDDTHPHPSASRLYSEHLPHRRSHRRHHHQHSSAKPLDISSLLKSTERSLLRAESDLRKTRRRIQLKFWEKIANWSEAIFLSYEAAYPHVDKDGVEGWTGLVASGIRLSSLWRQISWN